MNGGPSSGGPSPGSPEADRHLRRLEALYAAAPVNQRFPSRLRLPVAGHSEIGFDVTESMYHAAGAGHGTLYFKMLDDAAFYAANSMVGDVFLLTTQFNLFLTRPVHAGPLRAFGRWVSGHRRVLIAESRILDADDEEVARGQGSFMRSRIPLASLSGYHD